MIIGHVVKLDPTPRQQRALLSHIGAARFSYNAMLAYINDNFEKGVRVDVSGYALRKVWNEKKSTIAPWWADNSKESYLCRFLFGCTPARNAGLNVTVTLMQRLIYSLSRGVPPRHKTPVEKR